MARLTLIQSQILASQIPPAPIPSPLDLNNPNWEGLGAIAATILGLAAILVTVILWRKDRKRKELSYHTVSDTPLVSFREVEELAGRLAITFDNQQVQNLDI